MKEAVEWSSSLVPHSFFSSGVSVGHVLLLNCSVSGQLISTCSGVCGLCPQSQRGVLPIFSLCMCALRRQWPVLNRNIVVWKFLGRSCILSLRYLMLILFFHGLLVLFFKSVFVSWREILAGGCGLDEPSLASLSASSFPNSPQWAGIHCRAKVLLVCSWPKFRKIISTTSSLASDWRDWRAARQSLRIIMLLFVVFLSMRIFVASRIA